MVDNSTWITIGAILGGLGVAAGAFGAHVLESSLSPDDLSTFEIGVRYQMYHALILVLVGILSVQFEHTLLDYAGYAFTAGVFIFSGSLYILVLTDTRWLGAITPIGGVLLITGWFLLAYSGFQGST